MLSKHLKKAVERNKNEFESISPVSELDAEIIDSLIEIFGLIHYNELEDILENYKKISDQAIYDLLRLWIQNGSVPLKTMVKLGDKEVNLQYLQSISLIDSYDNKKTCPIYKIVINEDQSERLIFANTEIVFYSADKRQKVLDEFKEKTKYLKIKYL